MPLAAHTRRKCFISYHHDDEYEVEKFITDFDHGQDVLIARGIGASMAGDVINSSNDDYIKSRIRDLYLRDTTVTIVMIGKCTWSRKFVDWEIAASLRNTSTASRSGLMAITLPSVSADSSRQLPGRVSDNWSDESGYARWWKYPESSSGLANMIETAHSYRTTRAELVDNSSPLRLFFVVLNGK